MNYRNGFKRLALVTLLPWCLFWGAVFLYNWTLETQAQARIYEIRTSIPTALIGTEEGNRLEEAAGIAEAVSGYYERRERRGKRSFSFACCGGV